MKPLKPVLPSLKEKKRYLGFEIVSKNKIKDFSAVSKAIWSNVVSFVGIRGSAAMGLWILPEKYNAEKQKGLIRVNNNAVEELKASLALINTIDKEQVIVKSVGASGILRKAEQKFIGG